MSVQIRRPAHKATKFRRVRQVKCNLCLGQAQKLESIVGALTTRVLVAIDTENEHDRACLKLCKRYESKAHAIRAVCENAEKNGKHYSIKDNNYTFRYYCSCYNFDSKQGMFVRIAAVFPKGLVGQEIAKLQAEDLVEQEIAKLQAEDLVEQEIPKLKVKHTQVKHSDGHGAEDSEEEQDDSTDDIEPIIEWEIKGVGKCLETCTGRTRSISHNAIETSKTKTRGGSRKAGTQISVSYRANILCERIPFKDMTLRSTSVRMARQVLEPYINNMSYSIARNSLAHAQKMLCGAPKKNVKLLNAVAHKLNQQGHYVKIKYMSKCEYKHYFVQQAEANFKRNKSTLEQARLKALKTKKKIVRSKFRDKRLTKDVYKAVVTELDNQMQKSKDTLPVFSEEHPSVKTILDEIAKYPDDALFLKSWLFIPSFIADYLRNEGSCSSDTQTSIFEAGAAHSKETESEGTFFNIIVKDYEQNIVVVAKAWNFLPENTESWNDFLMQTTHGLKQVFNNRAAYIREGDRINVADKNTGELHEAVVQSVQSSLAGGINFEIKCEALQPENQIVSANELPSCSYNWSDTTIIADGNPDFENARKNFAGESHLFLCTKHRIEKACACLSKINARRYNTFLNDYSNFTPEKTNRIKKNINDWSSKETNWVNTFGFDNQMPWLSPMILINGSTQQGAQVTSNTDNKNFDRRFGGFMSLRSAVTDIISTYNKYVRKYQSERYVLSALHTEHLDKRMQEVLRSHKYEFLETEKVIDNGVCMTAVILKRDCLTKYVVRIRLNSHNSFKSKQNAENLNTANRHTANANFSEMNMSCTCGKPAFGMICDHVIVAANGFQDLNIFGNTLDYLPGSAQRLSQSHLYKKMKEADPVNFDTRLFSSTENVHWPHIAMQKAGACRKHARTKKPVERIRKRSRTSRK